MSAAGAALILLASLGFALSLVRTKKRSLETLRGMDAALERLYAELSLRQTSLPELTELLANDASGTAGAFFRKLDALLSQLGERPFSALWREALRTLSELDGAELDALERLGGALGRYALDEQLAAVADCRARLGRGLRARGDGLKEQKRLAYGLCLAAGFLLCILLY